MSTTSDRPAPFTIVPPVCGDVPLVVHIPHSATALPADVRAQLLLTDEELAEEEMEAVGMGAVYTRTSDGHPLRDLQPEQRDDLLARHFRPYHAALTELVSGHLDRHGRGVILDLHSYPRVALPYELHATGPRPEVDIGTDPRHTPGWLREAVVDAVTEAGLEHAENSPFTGTFVPTGHLGDPRVSSVMLELRRDTYLDEATARAHAGEGRIMSLVTGIAERLAAILTDDGRR